ncbi:Uncharacterized glycosyltransferase MJ1607 [Durusdinium trenchii]|uniref:Uncharacterized glycosyltransferase MJ1607 n=1 Tax=Durusdinium trenchii TaxID=1381693 RepID=A0ABP0LRK3_9DINO
MKILYSHRTLSSDGQHVHIRELTNALSRRGHELVVAAPESSRLSEAEYHITSRRGLKRWLPAPVYELAEFAYSAPAHQRILQAARRARSDVIYERYNLFFHAGIWAKRRLNLPMILEVNAPLVDERSAHGNLALTELAHRSERAIWRAADMVLPVSTALASHVSAAGVPSERIAVIHNGVSEAFLSPRDPSQIRKRYGLENKLVLGFAGFMRQWHNVDHAIRFLAEHDREDAVLLVVGDGPARSELETLAADVGVEGRVRFTGAVKHDSLPDHIAAFDIALQPGVVDYASPLKLFEYMALGKPVVAPDKANIREVLTDGVDGLFFTPGDQGSFDNSLRRLIGDEGLRTRLGSAARETVLRRGFTWAENARRIEQIAERLLETKNDNPYRD